MEPRADGNLAFCRVVLRPEVKITQGDRVRAEELHVDAHRACFIASSVNFPVEVLPSIVVGKEPETTGRSKGQP